MRIHSLYADILKSLTYMFDNIIYTSDTIKKYEFNIGNQTFQLDYETGFEFPSAIIKHEDARPINLHPTNIQHLPIDNINRIPVIFNRTKNLTIKLQEEHYIHNISVTINCESAYNAKELEFILLGVIPLSKWFQLYDFTSFINLDNKFINDDILNIEYDDIINLFMMFDYERAKPSYYFGINYRPFIRLNSVTSNVDSSSSSSYQLQISLELQLQMPQYLTIPTEEMPRYDIPERRFHKTDLVWVPENKKVLYLSLKDNNDNKNFAVIEQYNQHIEFIEHKYGNTGTFDSILKQEVITAKFEWINFKDPDNRYTDIESDIIITRNLIDNFETESSITILVTGRLFGSIKDISHNRNEKYIKGIFIGSYDNKDINDIIEFQYNILFISHKIETPSFAIIDNFSTVEAKIITQTNNLFHLIPNANENKIKLDYKNTFLKSLYLLDNNNDTIYVDNITNFKFDNTGNYSCKIIFNDNNSNSITGSVSGIIHPVLHTVGYTLMFNEVANTEYTLLALNFDIQYLLVPSYGSSIIERVVIDIGVDGVISNQPIIQWIDDLEEPQSIKEKKILNLLLYPCEYCKFDINNNLSNCLLTIISMINISNFDNWRFTVNGIKYDTKMIDQSKNPFQLINFSDNKFEFKMSKVFYYRTMRERFSKEYPILFSVFKDL